MAYLSQYRYIIDPVTIMVNGSAITEVPTNRIKSFGLEKDFDFCHFPLLSVSLNIKPKIYQMIQDSRESVTFKIRIQRYSFDQTDLTNYKYKRDFINGVFTTFIDVKTPILDDTLIEYDNEINNDDNKINDLANVYTFYLFKEKDISNAAKINNLIFTSDTLTNIVTYLFYTCGVSNVLMSKLTNAALQSEVLLPPYTLTGAINYLDQQYGLYTTGSVLFFDYDRTYLLQKMAKCTAWRLNEYKKVVFSVTKISNPNSSFPGSMVDSEKEYIYVNVTRNCVDILTDTITNDAVSGNNTLIVDPMSGGEKVTSNAEQIGSGTYSVKMQSFENPYIKTMNNMIINENKTVINIYLTETDISEFTPNKEYVMTFEDQSVQAEYGGNYRLTFLSVEYSNQGDSYFANIMLTLKRSL
ncbi:MAG: hypothetical protein PHF63_00770 [Herbinix sp.]|nr:hypothetical protein [Herbinix sp.]